MISQKPTRTFKRERQKKKKTVWGGPWVNNVPRNFKNFATV